MATTDRRVFLCPDNPANRQQHKDLEDAKRGGWQVTDAARDPLDPNRLLVTLSSGGNAAAPAPGEVPSLAGAAARPRRAAASPQPAIRAGSRSYRLDARPDPVDFRDRLYEPTLVEVPSEWPLERYLSVWSGKGGRAAAQPVLDQGEEGACTGFGLAAVAHYLLRRRKVWPDPTPVSARMFYEMARRHDEWEGEDYSGSSARGAMKGWHKHGVCRESLWPYQASSALGTLTPERAVDALRRPLGAYFRVPHRDLVAMHSALAEVGILYATATVHEGWSHVGRDGHIHPDPRETGGHAFVLVGYDAEGFWLQNSWGPSWGHLGFAHLTYDDWLAHGTDVWVARLGAPMVSARPARAGGTRLDHAGAALDVRRAHLQRHTVALGTDGCLRPGGEVGNHEGDIRRLFGRRGDIESLTRSWSPKRILLYAHAGLVPEPDALQRLAEYLPALLEHQTYPLAYFWKSDLWSALASVLKEALRQRRPDGALDTAKGFLLERLDDTLELVARPGGRRIWEEVRETARLAAESATGGARLVLARLLEFIRRHPGVEVHFLAHGAGSFLLGPVFREFCQAGHHAASLQLWAPACSLDFFRAHYADSLSAGAARRVALYTLKDDSERADHCAHLYHKSLLYLVANALEDRPRRPGQPGTPLLGLETSLLEQAASLGIDSDGVRREDPPAVRLPWGPDAWWIRTPNNLPPGDPFASTARRHGDFDDDPATVRGTLARIVGADTGISSSGEAIDFHPTRSGLDAWRRDLDQALR
ncbi:MAG: C1 family peptidase [Verrucomicrobiae bacterium]|nr:C1 family peptidase [Verrucomicrobiae bacterium]